MTVSSRTDDGNISLAHFSNSSFSIPESIKTDLDALTRLESDIKSSQKIHIIAGRELFNHPDRNGFISSLVKLKKVCNAKLSIIPPGGNFLGVARFGLLGGPGRSFKDILEKINSREVKVLFAFGSNPIEEFPDRKYVHDTLKKLELFVVVSPFMNSATEIATLVFPQALPSNYGGSFVNMEGRLQRFEEGPVNPYFSLRPVWSILGEFSDLLGLGTIWQSDSQILAEVENNISGMIGLTKVPEQGLILQHKDRNSYNPGESTPVVPPKAGADLPYISNYASSALHDGWITQKSENLMNIDGRQIARIHPKDAEKESLEDGQVVRIGNDETAINVAIEITVHVNEGEILILNSFDDNPVNRLMKLGEKTTFVSVRKT